MRAQSMISAWRRGIDTEIRGHVQMEDKQTLTNGATHAVSYKWSIPNGVRILWTLLVTARPELHDYALSMGNLQGMGF